MCTNAASRARDGDPRFAPVALAGYIAADTPDPRVSLLRAPRLANLSPFCGLHPAETVISCAITCLALQLRFLRGSESMGNHDSKIVDAGSVD